jgi:hypothetical protein
MTEAQLLAEQLPCRGWAVSAQPLRGRLLGASVKLVKAGS